MHRLIGGALEVGRAGHRRPAAAGADLGSVWGRWRASPSCCAAAGWPTVEVIAGPAPALALRGPGAVLP